MNTNRIITWGIFVVIVGLIIWGMIAASHKTARENVYIALMNNISSSDWVEGSASSTVTLVEYSDFQCPACALYFSIVKEVVKKNSDKMRFVYRHFPLPQHQNAIPAAKAAEAAGKQGKFWDMYEMIFSTHDEWENSDTASTTFSGYAEKFGLDMKKYSADLDSQEVKDKIDGDLKGGEGAGINSTPTFYLNGKKIEAPQSVEGFNKLINEAYQSKI